jgi:type I restriction enzyme S subunit
MTPETFFETFDHLVEIPNAVAKMRELVLSLAAQGRLVAQSPSDGSADELLAEITHKTFSDFDWTSYRPIDQPLPTLPLNWRWTPTSVLCELQTGKRMKGGAQDNGVISLGGEHLKPDGSVDYSVPRFVSREFFEEMPKGRVCIHDTLMVKDGATTGKAAFVAALPEDGLAAVNEHVFILRWHNPIEKRFAFYFIRAFALDHIATKSAGLIGGIRREAVLDFPFPLPPLAEQRRIVAKVDELFALCDRLEAQLKERETRNAALARASLARFTDVPTEANIAFLFHKSYDIPPADLRKSILTVAVRGKLIPQDPNDEPAETLFKRVAEERRNNIEQSSADAPGALGAVKENEEPFQLPPSWQWIRLGDVASIKHGFAFSSDSFTSEQTAFVLTTPGNFHETGGFRDRGQKTKYYDGPVPSGFALKPGDLIIPMTEQAAGLLGSPAFIPNDGKTYLHNQRLGKLSFYSESIAPEFVFWFFNCDFFRDELARSCAGMKVRHTSPKRILKVPFPLCSLAEQRRIVVKVEQLMALVDALETQLAASRASAANLVDAIVAELTTQA